MTNDERNVKLIALGEWVLEQNRENDICGGDVQDKAIELGLLHFVTVRERCGELCHCAEYYDEFPADCLRAVEVTP